MKNFLALIIICLVSSSSFSQNIEWEKDYPTALKKAQERKKVLIIYFNDRTNASMERLIKKEIFKSKAFKDISKNSTGLLIESPDNTEKYKFNSRVTSGHNPDKIFPSIKVINYKTNTRLPLLKEFKPSDIEGFLTQLKKLQK
ncbi:MAG: hypothetical protein HKP48_07140 [Winogradskyella sp.]|uniref:hypothetical protein n=1 Tax=Winogradskyella sp. TaxID=1883156 RepID=UPI0017CB2B29|nr:hypothetical protein [Winogradskyella sp.]MBT8245871.1 thioredoxin family protein [Winogradskyella sp.]NNK23058.1 hypothetical protein [Winogradskyella sp.]